MKKSPKTVLSLWKPIVKIGLALEVVCFAGVFYGYRRINRDQELRYQMYVNDTYYPFLELYYQLGEQMNSELCIRKHDHATWQKQRRPLRYHYYDPSNDQ